MTVNQAGRDRPAAEHDTRWVDTDLPAFHRLMQFLI
jgi:hypothetical protein